MIALEPAALVVVRRARARGDEREGWRTPAARRFVRGAGSRRSLAVHSRNCGSRAARSSPTFRRKSASRARTRVFAGEVASGKSLGARYYAPWLGRWTTADPLGLQAGLNLYLYGRASPVRYNDPSGMKDSDVSIAGVQEMLGRFMHGDTGIALTGENPAEYLGVDVPQARPPVQSGYFEDTGAPDPYAEEAQLGAAAAVAEDVAGVVDLVNPGSGVPAEVRTEAALTAAYAPYNAPKLLYGLAAQVVGAVSDVAAADTPEAQAVAEGKLSVRLIQLSSLLTPAGAEAGLGKAGVIDDVARAGATTEVAGLTGSELSALGAAESMFRKTKNTGPFKGLPVPMQMRTVKQVAEQAGVGLEGVKVHIVRDPELIGRNLYGYTPKRGNTFWLYPDAFESVESLVKTLGHERTHLMQRQIYGAPEMIDTLQAFEKGAVEAESFFWDYYRGQ